MHYSLCYTELKEFDRMIISSVENWKMIVECVMRNKYDCRDMPISIYIVPTLCSFALCFFYYSQFVTMLMHTDHPKVKTAKIEG